MTLLAVIAVPSSAQNRLRAGSPTPLLKEPNGLKIGTLVAGRSYQAGKISGTFVEATIEGWVPSSAVMTTTRDGFDLSITTGGGEALRAAPKGAVVARLQEGTLLSKVGTQKGWVHVRRTGYVLRTAFTTETVTAAVPPPPAPAPPPEKKAAATAPAPPAKTSVVTPKGPAGTAPFDSTSKPADAQGAETVSGEATLKAGAALAATPDGAPMATLNAPTDGAVVDRQRDWVKVRVEGWVRSSDIMAESASGPKITGAMVREHPDRYLGRTVTWRLQILAVQEADALRQEMPKGQPYLLARGPLPESGFVYLMVSKEQAAELKRLAPLDELQVEAVIRAGRTKYLPTPVLELVKTAAK